MIGGKLNPGDSPFEGPLKPSNWNSVVDARDDHLRRTRPKVTGYPGNGQPYRPNWTRNWHTVVQVRNLSGASLRRGDVIEFEGNPLSIVENDTLWLTGVAVDLTNAGWGIVLDPLAYNASSPEIGPVLIVGGCVANVVINNNDHKYATRKAGSTTLTSATRGPVRILYKPTGSVPEERRCHVQIMDENDAGEIVEVHHPSDASNGDIVEANEYGYHQGRIRTPNGTATYSIGEEVWIQFADGHDGNPDSDGQVIAVQGEYYGPAKFAGSWGEGSDKRPLYVCICDERSFVGLAGEMDSESEEEEITGIGIPNGETGTVSLLHSTTFLPSGLTKTGRALQDIPPGAMVKITRRAAVWMIELLDKTLVHFELIDELSITGTGSGHAKAKILTWSGSEWVGGEDAVEIEVYDWFPGMWNGLSGYRGWAEYRPTQYTDPGEDEEDEEDDVLRTVYEIIWMERPAQLIRFTSTGPMDGGELPVGVDWFDWQGRDPGSSITVHDPDGMFPDVHSGASGLAYYNNKEKRYEVLHADRVAIHAQAVLSENCCGSTVTFSSFEIKPCGQFVGEPPTAPTTAVNPCGHAGQTGATVTLRRISNAMPAPAWEVVEISKVVVQAITDLQLDGLNLQYRTTDIYVQRCESGANDWQTWHEGDDECPTPPPE